MQPMGPAGGWTPYPAPPSPAAPPWQDNRAFTQLAAATWVGGSALVAVLGIVQFHDLVERIRERRSASYGFGTGFGGATGGLASLLGLAVLVLPMIATWRLAKAQQVLGRPGSRWGPGWAIGARFIPLGNAVLPGLQLNELWKGSAPGVPRGSPAWREARGSAPAVAVIVATVASLVLSTIAMITIFVRVFDELRDNDVVRDERVADAVSSARPFLIAAAVVQFLASATNAWLLVRIAQRQQARYEEDPVPVVVQPPPPVGPATAWWPAAPTAAAPPSGPAAMAPGWYADPSARFTWRWWDGRAWTAHVQRDGLDAHDPPPG